MMRRAPRVDGNHADVKKALEQMGARVEDIAGQGNGCPDLLVGYRGINIVLEVKDGSLAPSQRSLNALQEIWHMRWPGQVRVVLTPEDAVNAVVAHAKQCGVL